jgi:hypothetical protein
MDSKYKMYIHNTLITCATIFLILTVSFGTLVLVNGQATAQKKIDQKILETCLVNGGQWIPGSAPSPSDSACVIISHK